MFDDIQGDDNLPIDPEPADNGPLGNPVPPVDPEDEDDDPFAEPTDGTGDDSGEDIINPDDPRGWGRGRGRIPVNETPTP